MDFTVIFLTSLQLVTATSLQLYILLAQYIHWCVLT